MGVGAAGSQHQGGKGVAGGGLRVTLSVTGWPFLFWPGMLDGHPLLGFIVNPCGLADGGAPLGDEHQPPLQLAVVSVALPLSPWVFTPAMHIHGPF